MKKSILLLTLFFTSISVNAIEENIVKSKVTEVTVYAKGVQLFQKANYTIKSGSSEIIIEGISPFIDPNSIQVRATGDVIILDSKHTIFYPKPEPVTKDGMPLKIKRDIQLLQDSLRMIGYDIQEIQDEINVFTATRNILSANGAVKGQGKVNDSIELLQNTLDYYAKKMLQLNKKLLSLKKKKAVQVDIKSKMNKRLRELKNYQKNSGLLPKKKKPIHRIVVTLMANKSVNGKVFVNYLSSNAGWIPHYDFRTKKDAGKVNLNYKAKVYQNTGLDSITRINKIPFISSNFLPPHDIYVDCNVLIAPKKLYWKNSNIQLNLSEMIEFSYGTTEEYIQNNIDILDLNENEILDCVLQMEEKLNNIETRNKELQKKSDLFWKVFTKKVYGQYKDFKVYKDCEIANFYLKNLLIE